MKTTTLKTRGRTFKGTVISSKAQKTVTVQWMRRVYVPKYERYHLKRSKVKAHNPPEMAAKEGDEVVIKECRPLSKTKNFVVVEVIRK
jgi:small subunit ribosomal protein S17